MMIKGCFVSSTSHLTNFPHFLIITCSFTQGILKGGKYHCTIDLRFDWFGILCMTTDNFCFYLQNRLIQISQTGGQWYSDTSPISIPCFTPLPKLGHTEGLQTLLKIFHLFRVSQQIGGEGLVPRRISGLPLGRGPFDRNL